MFIGASLKYKSVFFREVLTAETRGIDTKNNDVLFPLLFFPLCQKPAFLLPY
jgi:hypothetical protein